MKYTTCLLKRYGKGLFVYVAAAVGAAVMLGSTCSVLNKAPTVPVISGPSAGVVGVPVTFKATGTDPENDSIAFQFDWGDSSTLAWSDLIASGETASVKHTYTDSGAFSVKAKAKDQKGKESGYPAGMTLSVAVAGPGYPDSIVVRIPTHTGAYRLAVTEDGRYLYVTHRGFDLLSVVDAANRVVLKTITVGRNANDVTLTRDGAYALVTAFGDSSLSIVSTVDSQTVARVNVGPGPQYVAVDPSGGRAFVPVSSAGWVAVVTVPAGVFIDTLRTGGSPVGAIVDTLSNRLYVSDPTNNRILSFALPDLVGVASFTLASRPYDLALGAPGVLHARTAGDTVVVTLRTSDGVVTGVLRRSAQAQGIAAAPTGEYLYMTDSRTLEYVHVASMSIVDSLVLAQYPTVLGVAVDQAGSKLFIANYDEVVVVGRRTPRLKGARQW